jgi:putative transposase
MNDSDSDLAQQVALFRYGLIAELVRLPPGTPGLYRRLEALAAQDYQIHPHPGGRRDPA